MHDIQMRVMPALWLRGSLNAGMPLEMASTPVRAVVPLAKAWRSRKSVTACCGRTSRAGGSVTWPSVPVRYRKNAVPRVRNIANTKK